MQAAPPADGTDLVFMTNKKEPGAMARFRKIFTQVKTIATCHLLLDAATPGIEEAWRAFLHLTGMQAVTLNPFTLPQVAREIGVRPLKPGHMIPGSVHLPLLWLSRRLRHRDVWFVEDDVVFTGDWGALIRDLQADRSDLLCSHLSGYPESPDWDWWPTLSMPAEALKGSKPMEMFRRGFFPVFRISDRGLATVLAGQRAGWGGHCEVVIPTILVYAGCRITDLNRAGPAQLYSDGVKPAAGEEPGSASLRFRPPVTEAEMSAAVRPTIFHPVKLSKRP